MLAPSAPFAPTTLVDNRYELVEPLADYGVGESWRAKDTQQKSRPVAVKFLRAVADPAAPSEVLTRHLRALRAVRHPNLLAIINQGIWASRPYIVQDVFPGSSLGTGLDQARATGQLLPAELLSGLFDRVCAGVKLSP